MIKRTKFDIFARITQGLMLISALIFFPVCWLTIAEFDFLKSYQRWIFLCSTIALVSSIVVSIVGIIFMAVRDIIIDRQTIKREMIESQ